MASKKAKAKSASATKAAPARIDKSAYVVVLATLGLSGAASLIYEVVWVRQLSLSMGSTMFAGSTMLSAFLGGLALGGYWGGKRADSLPSPLKSLAKVEVAAAVVGAVSVPALQLVGRAYVLAAIHSGGSPVAGLALRIVMSLLVMLVPATLFGLTFPLGAAAASRVAPAHSASGGIYAASSFGSAFGAALCGLLLEPMLGLMGAALTGAAFQGIAAAVAWFGPYARDKSQHPVPLDLEAAG